jgi:di/tricarboxylate transporter
MDTAAVAGALTPFVFVIACDAGLSPVSAVMVEAIGTSLTFLLYQAAPFMVAYGFRYMSMRWLLQVMIAVSLGTLLILVPMPLCYWRLLGAI